MHIILNPYDEQNREGGSYLKAAYQFSTAGWWLLQCSHTAIAIVTITILVSATETGAMSVVIPLQAHHPDPQVHQCAHPTMLNSYRSERIGSVFREKSGKSSASPSAELAHRGSEAPTPLAAACECPLLIYYSPTASSSTALAHHSKTT